MMNPLTVMKQLKKGGIGPDELGELLGAMGIQAEFVPVPMDQAFPEFQKLAESASLPSANLLRLTMQMKGQTLEGLLVVSKGSQATVTAGTKS